MSTNQTKEEELNEIVRTAYFESNPEKVERAMKIIINDLTLADILFTIKNSPSYILKNDIIAISPSGQFIDFDAEPMGTEIKWDLTKNWSEQKLEVKQFVAELLK